MYIIEGNIGSGKSTLIRKLQEKSLSAFEEPVDTWTTFTDESGVSIFEYYYKEPTKYAFAFQMHVLMTRFQNMMKAKQSNRVVICERSIQTDKYIFAKCMLQLNNMTDIEYKVFDTYYKYLSDKYGSSKNDKIIYLRQHPHICQQRIYSRSRLGEEAISLDYLQRLHDLHDKWLLNNDNVIVIHDNDDCTVDKLIDKLLLQTIV
jgi:deoxyadenosine/deoxycytidine kinase